MGVALVVDLVWMGLALGAVLRKLGQSGAVAFVPVVRWMAAAQAARMSRVAVGLARGVAALGLVAMLVGLAWVLQEADAAPPAARLTLLVGAVAYGVGTLVGWILWIYGSGTIQLRLRAPSGLSWVAALVPHIWASILGWGRYSMAGRTDEAARRASDASTGPIRSSAVAASSFALRADDERASGNPDAARTPAPPRVASPLSPYAPPVAASAAAPEVGAEDANSEPGVDALPPGWAAVSPSAASAPATDDSTPVVSAPNKAWTVAAASADNEAAPDRPTRVSPFASLAPKEPPADMRALSAPSADDVPTLSAPTLDAASAAIPVVEATASSAASSPSLASAPSAPSPASSSPPATEPTPAAPTPVEAATDTLAISPYLTSAAEPVAEPELEPEPAADPVPQPLPEREPAPIVEVPVAPAVSPYLAPAPTGEAEPDWLVEARRQAQQQTSAPSVPTPEPEAETAAVPSLLPPIPAPAATQGEPDGEGATASATDEDDADDRTVLAARRRVTWSLTVGTDRYELPDRPIVIGRATPGGGADRIGIVDPTRTISKVHARLEPRADRWYVTDMGSTNGTVVRDAGGVEVEAGTAEAIEVTGTLLLGDLEVNLTREGDA